MSIAVALPIVRALDSYNSPRANQSGGDDGCLQTMPDIHLPASNGAGGLTLLDFRCERSGGARFDIAVTSRGFCGRSHYALEPEELSALIADLQRMYDLCAGVTEMRLHYDEEHVSFQFDSGGRLLVTGLLVQYEHPSQRLEFAFYSDQSCLPEFIAGLSAQPTHNH